MNTVYIELILLDNFFMDFVILYYTVRISVKNARLLRVLLAAALGGVYSVFAVFCDILISPVFKVAASFILITAAGGVKSLRSFFVSSAVFYGFSAGAAGSAGCICVRSSSTISSAGISSTKRDTGLYTVCPYQMRVLAWMRIICSLARVRAT